jgi:hypothetical protein
MPTAPSFKTPILSERQIEDFRRDGYLAVPGAFDANDGVALARWTTEIAERPEESGKHWVYHEISQTDPGADLICRIEKVAPFHPGFAQITRALAGPVGQLLGEDAVLFKEKINFKMPGGDGFKPHQDSQAGWEDYATYFITAMICIDEATLENGCLRVVAGHQNRGLFRMWDPLTDEDMAGMEFTPAPTKPGDVLLFDSYAPHYSEPNRSPTTRRLYFATYNKSSEGDHYDHYHADKYQNFPPDIDRDPDRKYVYRV